MATSIEKSSGRARYASYPSLVDRVVLITGGASGIGASFVEHFVAQGARVGFLDIDMNAGTALANSLGDARHKPLFVACDVTDIPALHAAIAEVRAAFGPIEVLVNNAANDRRHALADVTPESFDAGVAVNVRHQLFAAQAVVEDMKAARAGSIINLGSHCWMLKSSQFPVYAMSKAAVQGLTRGFAKDLGAYGIRETAQPVAHRRRPRRDTARPVYRRGTGARRSRAHGALPRGRRQPHDHVGGCHGDGWLVLKPIVARRFRPFSSDFDPVNVGWRQLAR
jgi:D-xylose 1-dehydrogenase